MRDNSLDRFGTNVGGGRAPPGGGSSISLGSSVWDGTATSPRSTASGYGRGPTPLRTQQGSGNAYDMMRSGPGAGMNAFDAPAAGGGARPDQRAHLGSNICFG